MKVKVLTAFVSVIDSRKYRVMAGDVLEMPAGADWLTAGLVEAVETAVSDEPAEKTTKTAVSKRGRKVTKDGS